MSLKTIIASASFLLVAGGAVYLFQQQPKAPNTFAGIPISQFSSKGIANHIIELKMDFTEVKTDDQKSTVNVKITMPFDFNEKLHYRWKLGENVTLAGGEISGELDHLLRNETKELSIDVKGFSKQNNHHVGFEIYGLKNGHKIYGEGLLASDLENTFESIVQNVEKIKASQ